MPDPIDIGGGLRIYDGDVVGTYQEARKAAAQQQAAQQEAILRQYQIQKTIGDLQQQPLELEQKKLQNDLSRNQVGMIPVDNAFRVQQLLNSQAEAARAKTTFQLEGFKKLLDVGQQSPEAFDVMLPQVLPGAKPVRNKDGTTTVLTPSGKAYTLDFQGVMDPEKRQVIERNYRNDWFNLSKEYSGKYQAYQNIEKDVHAATGPSDIKLLYNFMKLIDPSVENTVREGELALGKDTTNIPQQWVNLYNKAVSDKAPIFGEANSPQRKAFLETAKSTIDTSRATVLERGKFFHDIAISNRLKPGHILAPTGDLRLQDFAGVSPEAPTDQSAPPANPVSSQGGATTPQSASPTRATQTQKLPPPTPEQEYESLINGTYRKMRGGK